ncbi:MAG: GNAT family N-acetyltransferase [Pirellulales bacterium]
MTIEPSSTTPAVELRFEVIPADRAAVRSILESTVVFAPAEIEVAIELVDERLSKGAASTYEFIFATLGDTAIGYACYGPIPLTIARYDLYWIAVDTGHQGRHVARRLLQESERRIAQSGGEAIYIETSSRPCYEPARSFYLRSGYQLAAELPHFYAPGDHKLIYVKRLVP